MVTHRKNSADQQLDIAGTLNQTDDLDITQESQFLGRAVFGQSGSTVSISGSAPSMVLTGLTGIAESSVGNFITISGAASPGNNGTFLIITYISATSVEIENASGVGGDANNGSIGWSERQPWSAEDDHNYHRSDRAGIKGVAYDEPVPTFTDPDSGLTIPANLSNIGIALEYIDGYAGAVSSVFGRTGDVIAVAGDYDSDEVDNVSAIAGATVSDALETLNSLIVGGGGGTVSGPPSTTDNAIARWSGTDGYTIQNSGIIIDDLDNITGVTTLNGVVVESHASRHENGGADEIEISSLGTSETDTSLVLKPNGLGGISWVADAGGAVDSVFGRTGDVVALASDYDASQIDNDSGVPGAFVDDALDYLNNEISLINLDGYALDSDLQAHISDTSNPHNTSIANIGSGTLSQLNTAITDANVVPDSRTVIAGDGLIGGGDLSVDRTFNVAANADGSIVVNADDIQIGVLASDAQHGTRGGGTLHAEATTSVAGFMSAGDKTKLDGITPGAEPNVVDSVFGRTGDVVAVASDYDASQIDNDSGVPGAFVDDALDYLDGQISSINLDGYALDSDLQAHIGDTNNPHATDIGNLGSGTLAELNAIITDATLDDSSSPRTPTAHASTHEDGGSDEIDGYQIAISYSPSNYTPPVNGIIGEHIASIDNALANVSGAVTSVFGRTGDVVAVTGDYNSDEVDNVSTVMGSSVSDALEHLNNLIVGGGGGTVSGPDTTTDNAIARWSGTDGYTIQNSGIIIDDLDNITGVTTLNGVVVESHASRHEDGGADEINVANLSGKLADPQNVVVAKSGVVQSTRSELNFLDGNNTTITVVDNAGTESADITVDVNINLDGYVPDTRTLTAGAGLTGGGDLSADRTFDVVANVDGSIVVNANDIQVGVLASDAQHGTRGGGTLHAEATTSVAGFMSASDKTKLDGIGSAGGAPENVNKSAAAAGTSTNYSREDHKHDIDTATAIAVGSSNTEGTSTSLARADHTHEVTDLTITGEEQGSVLYYNGSNWVQLPPSDDGYVLTTNGTGENPTWEPAATEAKKTITVEFALDENVNNTTTYFYSWRGAGGDTGAPKRSGSSTGIQNATSCSPYQVPFNATITRAVITVKGVGVQNGTVTYPVTFQTDLFEQEFTTETFLSDINFSISNSFTVGTFSPGDTNFKGSAVLDIDVDEGDMLGLKFTNGNGASVAGQMRNAWVTLILEER